MKEQRRHIRMPFIGTVQFSVSVLEHRELKRIELDGTGRDISEKGVGFNTSYPVESGHVLCFKNGVGQKTGVVRWSRPSGDGYSVGVEFI